MNKYTNFKSSEIDWIGDIPSHWKLIKPKYNLKRVTRPYDHEDEVITCFRDGVVTLRKNRREVGFTNSIKEHGYQQIRPGDLVVHEMDGFAGAIGISDSQGKATPVYTVIEPDEKSDLRYIAHLLRAMSQTGKTESLSRSIRQRTTDFRWNMWSTIHFPFPPVNEQKKIVEFIETKKENYETLTFKLKKKIELLIEQKTSTINHYVTKGFDVNNQIIDSGINWIGKIPESWNKLKLKYFASVHGRIGWKALTASEYVDEGYIFLSTPNIKTRIIDFKNVNYITKKRYEESPELMLKKNDVLFVKTGSTLGIANYIYELPSKATVNSSIIIIRIKENLITPKFLNYYLQSHYVQSLVKKIKIGMGVPSITQEDIKNFFILVPPLAIQKKIEEKIEKEVYLISKKIEKYETKIEKLKEYYLAIKYYALTGKLKVF